MNWKEAIEENIEMWDVISKKEVVPSKYGERTSDLIMQLYPKSKKWLNASPLCEIFHKEKCIGCPLASGGLNHCTYVSNPYDKWCRALDGNSAQMYARELVDTLKEALEVNWLIQ